MNLKAFFNVLIPGSLAITVPGCAEKAPPAPAPQSSIARQPADAPGADASATLSQLTQALRKYSLEKQRLPASIEELVAARYATLPQAPPGQKFSIDAATVQVILVKK